MLVGRRRSIALVIALSIGMLTGILTAQEKGGSDETGPYDVVENWFKPVHEAEPVRARRLRRKRGPHLPGDRSGGRGVDASGPCTAERSKPGTHSHLILVIDRNGKVTEEWTQWSHLFGLPHAIKINPYDPRDTSGSSIGTRIRFISLPMTASSSS